MSKSYGQLLDRVRKLRLKGESPKAMRQKLLEQGWDMNTIDRALWQLGFRDRKNVFFVGRVKKYGYVAVGIVVFAAVVGGVLRIDRSRSDPESTTTQVAGADTDSLLSGNPVSSEQAGISFDFPASWTQKSLPSENEGVYVWQIEPISNKDIKRQLEESYGLGQGTGEASTAQFALLGNPLVNQLTTISVLVTLADSNEIEESIDEWKQNIDIANGQFGLTTSEFQSVEQDGMPGYSYVSKVELGELKVTTRELVFLDSKRKVEISVFPVASDQSIEIGKILESIQFN